MEAIKLSLILVPAQFLALQIQHLIATVIWLIMEARQQLAKVHTMMATVKSITKASFIAPNAIVTFIIIVKKANASQPIQTVKLMMKTIDVHNVFKVIRLAMEIVSLMNLINGHQEIQI